LQIELPSDETNINRAGSAITFVRNKHRQTRANAGEEIDLDLSARQRRIIEDGAIQNRTLLDVLCGREAGTGHDLRIENVHGHMWQFRRNEVEARIATSLFFEENEDGPCSPTANIRIWSTR
jgi:hypothetical protein